jgi:hypothetical protein
MVKCDSCPKPAAYTVAGYYLKHYFCAPCAASLCLELGDYEGVAKFTGQ